MKKNLLIALWLLASCKDVIPPLSADSNENSVSARNSMFASIHPNIILILGDDVGYEILSCNGGQSYETSQLDKMAARGRRFTQCHASPLCCPSRVALLTGKYNFRNYTNWGYLDPLTNKTIGNMMQDEGYATCYAGKWQLDGYDASIRAFGWEKYSVWQPGKGDRAGSRYKNPHIYQDGNFLPDSSTVNKYADDMFVNYIAHFMNATKQPFFIYYAMSLVHDPYSPTPDDPEFASWDPNNPGDVKFFPSMVKYMDKKVGQLLSLVDSNTFVIYVGDNGSPQCVYSLFNGVTIRGGKTTCSEYGTHVPLILYRAGKVAKLDSSLIDLTDFLPTLCSIARIPVPVTYGTLDGTSFYPQLSKRQSIYYHYVPHPDTEPDDLTIWVQDRVYKKYDTTVTKQIRSKRNKLFNIHLDIDELNPIKPQSETAGERGIDSTFKSIIEFYSKQQ